MTDLNSNFANTDTSMVDIQILNSLLFNKDTPTHSGSKEMKQGTPKNLGIDMPSIKLFKRMTTLKKEKNDLEREVSILKERNDDLRYLN